MLAAEVVDQTPVPLVGVLASSVTDVSQVFWLGPTFAGVGGSSTSIKTASSVIQPEASST